MYDAALLLVATAAGASRPLPPSPSPVAGTLIRFLRLRRHVDRPLLWRFGLTSAAGGPATLVE